MKTNLLLLILICFIISSCKKDYNNTPKPTVRKDIFECKVNGQLWLPEASFPENALTSSFQNNLFVLLANRSIGGNNPIYEEISYSGYFSSMEESDFNGINHIISFRKIINGNYHKYIVDSAHNGKITITKLDTIAGIIAATFYFDAIDTTTNEVVHITEGKFDVKY